MMNCINTKNYMLECGLANSQAKTMLIRCKCGSKAKIYSRQNINPPQLFKIYTQCQNEHCNRGVTFMVSEFEELRASELEEFQAENPLKEELEKARAILNSLPPELVEQAQKKAS